MSVSLETSEQFKSLLESYDTFLFDCDGVIWSGPRGDELTRDAVETIRYLKSIGKQLAFVTNNATKSRSQYLTKFKSLGFEMVQQEEIFTCGSASASYLKDELLPQREREGLKNNEIYVIGQAGLEEELIECGIQFKGGTDPEDNVLMPYQDFTSIVPDPSIGIVLFSFQMHWNYKQYCKAYNYLASNPSCELVLTNDDQTVLVPDGVCPGEGAMASVLYGARKGLKPIIVGKPNTALMHAVNRAYGFDPKRTIMIGDRLETDVLFGKNGGISTLLVMSGYSTPEDLLEVDELHRPDYVAECIGDILKAKHLVFAESLQEVERLFRTPHLSRGMVGMSQQPPTHTRRSSSHSSFHPPVPSSNEAGDEAAFANAFWSFANMRPRGGQPELDRDLGKEGYETLMGRMKQGTKTLEELRALFKERASMEDEFAKKLNKLSRSSFGVGEIGHMERALSLIKSELETTSKSHSDLSTLLRQYDSQVAEFIARRENSRKNHQVQIEKNWKLKKEQRDYVEKAKTKYESDAVAITGLQAQAALSLGRDLDKVHNKLDKYQQTVQVNEKDYRHYSNVLKETTVNWNMMWRQYCDLCQDQEEERLDFVKSRMWDWANALSTVAVAEDESAERVRTALEQCEPATDLKIFVAQNGTGRDIPDPPEFIDYSRKDAAQPKQTFTQARFPRSSTRAIKHSPSTVNDITRAISSTNLNAVVAPPPQQQPRSNNSPVAPANGAARPQFAPPMAVPQQQQQRGPHSSAPQMTMMDSPQRMPPTVNESPVRPPLEPIAQSRFNVSPGATASNLARTERGQAAEGKNGVINAGAFRRGLSHQDSLPSISPAPARYEGSLGESTPEPIAQPPTTAEDDDPLMRALNQLHSEQAPLRPQRSSVSINKANVPKSSSRPTSPGPAAAMMQPPSQSNNVGQTQQVINSYGQSFPGERQQSTSRPHSRQGSNASAASYTHGRAPSFGAGGSPRKEGNQGRSTSPTPFAGIGARGRSTSPQPFIQSGNGPRAASPRPVNQQSPSYNQLGPVRPISPITFPTGSSGYQPQSQPQYAQQGRGQGYSTSSPYSNGNYNNYPQSQPSYPSPNNNNNNNNGYGQPSPQRMAHGSQPSLSSNGAPSGYPMSPGRQTSVPSPISAPIPVQQQQQQQQQHSAPVPAPVQSQQPQPVSNAPPTGQYTEDRKPILFYVQAIYDYEATGQDEFSFNIGDVIAVTATEADGWWQGQKVGITGGGTTFPSNFTELLE